MLIFSVFPMLLILKMLRLLIKVTRNGHTVNVRVSIAISIQMRESDRVYQL